MTMFQKEFRTIYHVLYLELRYGHCLLQLQGATDMYRSRYVE